jgi:hypothetical protein
VRPSSQRPKAKVHLGACASKSGVNPSLARENSEDKNVHCEMGVLRKNCQKMGFQQVALQGAGCEKTFNDKISGSRMDRANGYI